MNVVLDTNVVVSGVFFGGAPLRILTHWRAGRFTLFVSPLILEEYRRVTAELANDSRATVAWDILDLIAIHADVLLDTPLPAPICRDPSDDKFIACAVNARALLVTGDKDLLAVNLPSAVRILTPRAFLTLVGE